MQSGNSFSEHEVMIIHGMYPDTFLFAPKKDLFAQDRGAAAEDPREDGLGL